MSEPLYSKQSKRSTKLSKLLITLSLGVATTSVWASDMDRLNFSIPSPAKAVQNKKDTDNSPNYFYQQQTRQEITTFSNYELNNWFDLELDMKALKTHNDPTQTLLNPKSYSAFANFGHSIDVSSERFRPFAKVGLGYDENPATSFNPNYIESDRVNKTQLQFGVGVRYSRQNWKSFGVSFSYQSNSPLMDQQPTSSTPNGFEKKDSIDLKFDFGF
ncbi:outer membrane beta-barrel protein [Hydrogenovibrio sp. JE_KL2]|uniref:outer membrane beta-barrel protein n=1 Tax=Hydrogenovibrio sp. JE_KL2 TaxID=2651188 RepID=UPI00128E2884|nr:outer membrane beta-barrel protein [Hydrogenovibrio sp. JE_KL2]MPQ77312.1 porin family protein [Hydrogenovibrio sp. JE_KL2]